MPMMDVFVYGTLMNDAFVATLTGRVFRKEPARLAGYRKTAPRHGYPCIIEDPAGAVEGFVLRDIDPDTLRVLDRYEEEGRLYRRTSVRITVAGQELPAMAYVAM